jgi:Ca-activated chloride channel family protein
VKRTALSAYPRESVASLAGDSWLAFLDRTGNTKAFTEGPGRRLVDLAYVPETTIPQRERTELIDTVRQWIEHHSPEAG